MTAKSYASEENLKKLGLDEMKPLVVRNREGRYTAVFGLKLSGIEQPFVIANMGFIIIN